MKARPPLPGGPYLVVGLARSGIAAALALRARGERVIGVDTGSAEDPNLRAAAGRLSQAGVEVHLDASGDAFAAGAQLAAAISDNVGEADAEIGQRAVFARGIQARRNTGLRQQRPEGVAGVGEVVAGRR